MCKMRTVEKISQNYVNIFFFAPLSKLKSRTNLGVDTGKKIFELTRGHSRKKGKEMWVRKKVNLSFDSKLKALFMLNLIILSISVLWILSSKRKLFHY